MNLIYRTASLDDIDDVMKAIEDSRKLLKEQGNGQWQDGYPNREDLLFVRSSKRKKAQTLN